MNFIKYLKKLNKNKSNSKLKIQFQELPILITEIKHNITDEFHKNL